MYNYDELLHRLGHLRASGVPENDERITTLRIKLREALDRRRKYRKTKGPLPTVTAMQTVKLNSALGETSTDYKKYALMGIAVGIIYVLVRLVIAHTGT